MISGFLIINAIQARRKFSHSILMLPSTILTLEHAVSLQTSPRTILDSTTTNFFDIVLHHLPAVGSTNLEVSLKVRARLLARIVNEFHQRKGSLDYVRKVFEPFAPFLLGNSVDVVIIGRCKMMERWLIRPMVFEPHLRKDILPIFQKAVSVVRGNFDVAGKNVGTTQK